MPVRSTKEKATNRERARQLYLKEGLSLEEISHSIGETVKTIRAWRSLGEWDLLWVHRDNTERDRLQHVRSSLFDRIEAQLKDNKLPHTEIGLLAKVDRMIARQEEKDLCDPARIVLATLEFFVTELQEHDRDLLRKLGPYIKKVGEGIKNEGLGKILR